jgi:protein-disulfide isomerase
VLSVVGLAAVFHFAYATFFVLHTKCPLCMAFYVMAIGVFIVALRLETLSLMSLPGRLLKDMRAVFTNPVAATLALVWLVGSVWLIAYSREPGGQAGTAAAAAAAPAPLEAIEQAQLDEWHQWLDRQERKSELAPQGPAKVLLVKFNDYQCPSCRASYYLYKDSIAKFEKQYPGVFKFETRDYPLNPECGMGGAHPNACEGAVAVRLAREHGKGPEMEAWLFDHQEEQSRSTIKSALQRIASVSPEDYEAKYKSVLPQLHESAQFGSKLGVTGTPTFFLNGMNLKGSVRVNYFEEAIAYELKKAGVS